MKARNIVSVFASLGIILSLWSYPSVSAEGIYSPKDIDSHWAENEMSSLMYADILRGSNNNVNPDSMITRGEFTALIARTLALGENNTQEFTDIKPDHMFFKEIGAAYNAGLINGVGNGTFQAQKNITREEIMLIIARTLPDSASSKVNFKDIASSYRYTSELRIAVGSGIITGFSDNTFRPKKNATRAECAVMLQRLLTSMENINKKEAESLADEYIQNHLKDTKKNLSVSVGRAKSETQMQIDSQEKIKSLSTQVEKLPYNTSLSSITVDGYLATAVFNGEITYVTTNTNGTRNRTYNATHKVDIIQIDDRLYVYDYTLTLQKAQKVNLTWEVYSSVPDYAPHGVNVVSPSSFQISAESLGVESKNLYGNVKFYNSLTRKYMTYAKENGYEVWPIYKTDFTTKTSDSFLNNSDARQKAISYITEYACRYLIDGINIDFENIYEKNRYLVTAHARELSVMLHEMGLIVSVDITRKEPTSANWSMCYNRDALSQNTDYIMLMAYDEYYASSKTAGSVASLDWVDESVQRTLKEVPADKLILGIPFYMRYFETKNGKVTSSKAISMQTAYELITSNNVTYTYIDADKQYKISWKSGDKTCVFWLENTDTIAKRVKIANDYFLAGVASWRRGLEISKAWEVIDNNL